MSVVVWDGYTLAADMQVERHELIRPRQKMWLVEREGVKHIVSGVGMVAENIAFRNHFAAGRPIGGDVDIADVKNYFSGSSPIVVDPQGVVVVYFMGGAAGLVEEDIFPSIEGKMAWGAGSHCALGALAMGADAKQAVEVACSLHVDCGFGVFSYNLDDLKGDT